MLLDESPADLVSQTVSNFNIAPDRHTLSRIQDSLSTLATARSLRLSESEQSVRKLARNLSLLTNQHRELISGGADGSDGGEGGAVSKHAAEISELDTKKFRVAKMASEAEMEVERLEGELERMRERLAVVEAEGVEGGEEGRRQREWGDATVLRLKIYRSLGIDIEPDAAGNYTKAIIRNNKKGDVHVVNIDPKFSKQFYANYFWNTMQA